MGKTFNPSGYGCKQCGSIATHQLGNEPNDVYCDKHKPKPQREKIGKYSGFSNNYEGFQKVKYGTSGVYFNKKS